MAYMVRNWDPSDRWASGGSCGWLIVFLHHYVGAGCLKGWADSGVKKNEKNENRVPGPVKNTCKSKNLAVCFAGGVAKGSFTPGNV